MGFLLYQSKIVRNWTADHIHELPAISIIDAFVRHLFEGILNPKPQRVETSHRPGTSVRRP